MEIPAKRKQSWRVATALALFAIATPFAYASPTCLPNPSGSGLIVQKWNHSSAVRCRLSATALMATVAIRTFSKGRSRLGVP